MTTQENPPLESRLNWVNVEGKFGKDAFNFALYLLVTKNPELKLYPTLYLTQEKEGRTFYGKVKQVQERTDATLEYFAEFETKDAKTKLYRFQLVPHSGREKSDSVYIDEIVGADTMEEYERGSKIEKRSLTAPTQKDFTKAFSDQLTRKDDLIYTKKIIKKVIL